MKGSGLNNHPSRQRRRKPIKPCGNRFNPGYGGGDQVCVLDRDHKGRCQGPFLHTTAATR